MSHTFHSNGASFVFNSDLSGKVTIDTDHPTSGSGVQVSIPGRALLDFVAMWLVRQRIARLEDLEGAPGRSEVAEVLGLQPKDIPQ